jgi:hypothetical protein
MRVLIGITQALITPGRSTVASSSSISLSTVIPARHSGSGLNFWL